MNVSVIIPTIGRPTLIRTIRSVFNQLSPDDELIVVHDSDNLEPVLGLVKQALLTDFLPANVRVYQHGPTRNFGNSQRTFGQRLANGKRLMFIDDDDEYLPNAVAEVKKWHKTFPRMALIFKMFQIPTGRTLWETEKIVAGNIGTPMVVALNEDLPAWDQDDRYGNDFPFFEEVVYQQAPVQFINRVISLIHHVR